MVEQVSESSVRMPRSGTQRSDRGAPASAMSASATPAVPALVQAFAIIDALTQSNRTLRLTEIANQAKLPKTTAFRLLKTLMGLDIVRKRDNGFYLGARLTQYGPANVPVHTDLIGLFYALIGPVNEELDETIQLGILTDSDVTFLAFVNTSRSVRLVTRVGRRLPAHASATGKAILAFSPDEVVQQVLASDMAALTANTITDPDILLLQLEQIKTRGWAEESQESTSNLSCVAVPILDQSGNAKAAITACVAQPALPISRQQSLAVALSNVANHLSRRIHS